ILLVGAFILSAVTFASPYNNSGMMGGNYNNCSTTNGNGMMGGNGMMNGNGMMYNITPDQRMFMEKNMIAIQEKQIEVRKLMNTTKPDTAKIEKLNSEIINMRTNHMESMQKLMAAPAKTN
ncbi:MAG: hypothetical protein ACRCUA_01645, partial [Fusobacteriaceae bacterium]